jgi:RNA polymerase sigma-70 factor (ECF subfamily)
LKENGLNIEKELIEQFVSGDDRAFELIFDRSKGRLKGFLRKVLPGGEDEESVLQEIYLKLWTTRIFIQPDKNFEAYFFSIARNLVIDVMRKRLHRQKYLEDLYRQLKENQKNGLDTCAAVEYSELERKIFSLMQQLPEKRREIFRLNRIEGLTYREIALKLNISENTVDSQIRKALAFFHIGMKHFLSLFIF